MYQLYLSKKNYEEQVTPAIDIIKYWDLPNIFPCSVPQDEPRNFIRYYVINTEHEYTNDGDACKRRIWMQFDCYSGDYNEAIAMADQIKDIDSFRGRLGNTKVLSTVIENDFDVIEQEQSNKGTPLYRRIVELNFTVRDKSVAPKSSNFIEANLESGIYHYLNDNLNQSLEPGKHDQENDLEEKILFYKTGSSRFYNLDQQHLEEADYAFRVTSPDYARAWAISEKLRGLLSAKRDNYGNQINVKTELESMSDDSYEDGKYQVESSYKIFTHKT